MIIGCSSTVDNLLIDRKVTLDCQGRQRIQISGSGLTLIYLFFREKNKLSSIISAIESYKELLLIVRSPDYWPWKLSHDVRSAGQRSIPSRLILPRQVMKYNVLGSSFFTNLPAAKAMENSAKYTKVNKVEVMTFSAII